MDPMNHLNHPSRKGWFQAPRLTDRTAYPCSTTVLARNMQIRHALGLRIAELPGLLLQSPLSPAPPILFRFLLRSLPLLPAHPSPGRRQKLAPRAQQASLAWWRSMHQHHHSRHSQCSPSAGHSLLHSTSPHLSFGLLESGLPACPPPPCLPGPRKPSCTNPATSGQLAAVREGFL